MVILGPTPTIGFVMTTALRPKSSNTSKRKTHSVRHVSRKTSKLQESLYTELVGRVVKDDSSVPVKRRNYFYYVRYETDREYPIYCRRLSNMEAHEEIILDVNTLAEGHAYYAVGALAVSEDEQLLAFTEDTVSRRLYTVRFRI